MNAECGWRLCYRSVWSIFSQYLHLPSLFITNSMHLLAIRKCDCISVARKQWITAAFLFSENASWQVYLNTFLPASPWKCHHDALSIQDNGWYVIFLKRKAMLLDMSQAIVRKQSSFESDKSTCLLSTWLPGLRMTCYRFISLLFFSIE